MGFIKWLKGWWNGLFKSEAKNEFGVSGITSGRMQDAVQKWILIYRGDPGWTDEEAGIRTIKFAKVICGEVARLATLAIDVQFDGSRAEYMQGFWEKSVKRHLREWIEHGCAAGTVILKPNGKGIDFVLPDRFEIVGKDENGNISGIVFQDSYRDGDLFYTKLEYHRYETEDTYVVSNRAYVSGNEGEIGKPVDLKLTKWDNLQPDVSIAKKNGGAIDSMLFGLFRMPSSNDIDMNSPLGLSVFANAVEELRDLDVAYSRNAEEISDSRKLVLIDERLTMLPAKKDKLGNTTRQYVRLPHFVRNVMGESEKEFYQEINPQLNTDTRQQGINNLLSLIGCKCGFSNGYFVLDEKTGMVTATQVESDDRRTIQLIKDVRDALQQCLDEVFYAQSVFADLYGGTPSGEYEATYDFGDITYNHEEDKLRWWGYVTAGKVPFWTYLMKFEGYSEKEAKELSLAAQEEDKEEQGLFDEE